MVSDEPFIRSEIRWRTKAAYATVERMQEEVRARVRYRCVEDINGVSLLREGGESYSPISVANSQR